MIPALMYLFLGLGLMACISLFFPRAAFFLKNPTRWKAAGAWVALCIITFFVIAFGFGDELKQHNAQSKAKTSTEAVSVANAAEAAPVWDITKAKPLPYAIIDFDMERRAATGRNKASVRIILATVDAAGNVKEIPDTSQFTKEQLAATVIAAAKYAAQQSKAHFVGVALLSQFDAGYATTQLAVADYAPDGKGVSGRDNWQWQMVQAAENGLTKQEVAMQSLWGKLRDQYQTPMGTDEAALSAAISKELGIPAEQVNIAYKPLLEVPKEFMDAVPADPGVMEKKRKK